MRARGSEVSSSDESSDCCGLELRFEARNEAAELLDGRRIGLARQEPPQMLQRGRPIFGGELLAEGLPQQYRDRVLVAIQSGNHDLRILKIQGQQFRSQGIAGLRTADGDLHIHQPQGENFPAVFRQLLADHGQHRSDQLVGLFVLACHVQRPDDLVGEQETFLADRRLPVFQPGRPIDFGGDRHVDLDEPEGLFHAALGDQEFEGDSVASCGSEASMTWSTRSLSSRPPSR